MIVFNIAEWIANIFILGIAGLIWAITIFLFMLIFYAVNKIIKGLFNEHNN